MDRADSACWAKGPSILWETNYLRDTESQSSRRKIQNEFSNAGPYL